MEYELSQKALDDRVKTGEAVVAAFQQYPRLNPRLRPMGNPSKTVLIVDGELPEELRSYVQNPPAETT